MHVACLHLLACFCYRVSCRFICWSCVFSEVVCEQNSERVKLFPFVKKSTRVPKMAAVFVTNFALSTDVLLNSLSRLFFLSGMGFEFCIVINTSR